MADRKTWRRPIRTTQETINTIISLFKSGMMSRDIYWLSKKDKSVFGYRVHQSTISKVLKDNGFDAKENTIWGTKLSRKEDKTERELEFYEGLNALDSESEESNEIEGENESSNELENFVPQNEALNESYQEFEPQKEFEYEDFEEPGELEEFQPKNLPLNQIKKQLK